MMFRKNKNRDKEIISLESVSILSASASIKGVIILENDFRIDGVVEGDIIGQGKIIVGPGGCVRGNIRSRYVDLMGKTYGDVEGSELVVLRTGSYCKGEITAKHLEIEAGAEFYGNCNMTDTTENTSAAKLEPGNGVPATINNGNSSGDVKTGEKRLHGKSS